MQKLKKTDLTVIHQVRLETDQQENERRIQHELKMENLNQKLINESKNSRERQNEVHMKWSAIERKVVPQVIFDDIKSQEELCKKIIDSKNRLIQELQKELISKDAEYVKSLKDQNNKINLLMTRMKHQYTQLSSTFEQELRQFEENFANERQNLLLNHKKIIEQMNRERSEEEKKFVEKRKEQVEKNERELHEMREAELEKYSATKKEMDDEIHDLEQQMDFMRGVYQLNGEMITYYYNVLVDRVAENKTARNNNKTKLAKLQDQLSGIKAKYARDDKKYKSANNETAEQLKRITKQYKELLIKFKFFELNDLKKYKDIWKMHQETVKEYAEKLLSADKIITERYLGLEWIHPDDDENDDRNHNGIAASSDALEYNVSSNNIQHKNHKTTSNQISNLSIASTGIPESAAFHVTLPNAESSHMNPNVNSNDLNSSSENNLGAIFHPSSEVTKRILQLLCDEADFLIEEKVHQAIRKLESEEEGMYMRIEAILKALGIEGREEIDKLMEKFVEEVKGIDEVEQFSMSQAKNESNGSIIIVSQHSMVKLVSPQNVIRILKSFIEDQQKNNSLDRSSKQKAKKILTVEERQKDHKRQEELKYWKQMASIIPDDKLRVWSALEDGLEKYNDSLIKRANLIEETEMIRLQNLELRDLLNQYLSQKINQELYVPAKIQ